MTCNACTFATNTGKTHTVYCEVNKMDMLKTYPECDLKGVEYDMDDGGE